ncbi:DUF1097 domain-containing protein [Clostridium ganghwense]|uniref:DUF1097 domain-containing protein n=1 Tax=Clostridium ganghwense TaxID=312089 RepID=A0ABT4CSU5_9CLOT|nr:DUF1097 domain-containing protein [Clostridium ganghwense]MCY6371039.1 DUF1097 domain-containing protein [Clostridium ganghwense]
MKKVVAIGISSGIIAVLWTIGSFSLGLSTVAGFLAWSSFFAAGGGQKGVKKALIANLSGICWGFLTLQLSNLLSPHLGEVTGITIGNGLGSAGICIQSKLHLVAFIPASFIGWSAFIASGMNFSITVISMTIGSLLGYTSEKLTNIILNILTQNNNLDKIEIDEVA